MQEANKEWNKLHKKLTLLFIGISWSTLINANGGFSSFYQAQQNQLIDLACQAMPGQNTNYIVLTFNNNTSETLLLELEAGTLLDPFSPSHTSLLSREKHRVALPAEVSKTLKVAVYSTSLKKMPADTFRYAIAKEAPEKWYQAANYLAMNEYDSTLAQKAIWAITANFPFSAVCSEQKDQTQRLRTYLTTLLDETEEPWVALFFQTDSTGRPVRQFQSLRISTPYQVRNNTMLSFYILNQSGQLIQKLQQGIPRNPGNYTYEVELRIAHWPPGIYQLVIRSPEQMLLRKQFVLEVF